jgi:iron complex outermembrane recepter protein
MKTGNKGGRFALGLLAGMLGHATWADEAVEQTLPDVEVVGEKIQSLPAVSGSVLGGIDIYRLRTSTSDTAKLLDGQPGVSLYGAGGVSSLPAIHGMADDRVRIKVDGMDLISACANHMNPPLSYMAPASVSGVKVFAGIVPVSLGGDSIGGTIQVDSAAPEFAREGQGMSRKGQVGMFYRNNGNAQGANLSATIASETLNMSYSGSTVRSDNYKAAKDFHAAGNATGTATALSGDEVGSSFYQSTNQSLGFALRQENHLLELKLGFQNIPRQGFPNQRMDMAGNDSQQFNLHYAGQYQWGALEARAYHEHTRHSMNFLDDKLQNSNPSGMPMDTDGKNTGLLVKADIMFSERDIFRMGSEYQRYRLNDWWSPVSATPGMMGDGTFWNINSGQRDRFDVFGEWEAYWNSQWISQFGVRSDTVKMNAGLVRGYNNMGGMMGYGDPSNPATIPGAFNTLDHNKTDNNLDLTALARYEPDAGKTFEFGFAQKTRSPNLYERFAWSTSNTMVMNMNNWVGDGNGYVGNIDLKPEVAHTLSATGNWHDAKQEDWELKITPYYTRVQDYIDAVACAAVGKTCPARPDGFLNLSLANQSARLYGVDLSARKSLAKASDYGSFGTSGVLNYVNGKNLTTGDNLYNIMPLNLKLAVEQRTGAWTNTMEVKLVSAKTHVQAVRQEIRTSGYGLLNLYSSYESKRIRFDLGLENVLNRFYILPLGGAYLGQGNTMGTAVPYGTSVPGMGRSLNAGLTLKF